MRTMAEMRGVHGYLDGTITRPSTLTTESEEMITVAETLWNSKKLSLDEWKTRDVWTKTLLTFNIKDPDGLGIDTTGTSASIWKSAKDNYKTHSEMTRINADNELRTLKYTNDDDFPTHLSIMRNKLSQVRAMGIMISDTSFKTILLNSLPKSWNPAVALLYNNMPLSKAIQQLNIWWLHTKDDRPKPLSRSVIALQTNTYIRKNQNLLVYTNPNCNHRGHTIDVCYWPGGGKEGQFPPDFGKRGEFKGSATNTCQGTIKPPPTVNAVSTSEDNDQIFAYMTMGDTKFKVPATLAIDDDCTPDDKPPPSFSDFNQQTCDKKGVESLKGTSAEMPLVFHTDFNNKPNILMLLDSGASDHCFADLSLFTSYTPFNQPLSGLTAEKGLTFNVVGRGNIEFQTKTNGVKRTITIDNALYTPGFRSNLISMSKLSIKGVEAIFKDDKAVIRTQNGTDIMSATQIGQLYIVEMDKPQPTALITQSK